MAPNVTSEIQVGDEVTYSDENLTVAGIVVDLVRDVRGHYWRILDKDEDTYLNVVIGAKGLKKIHKSNHSYQPGDDVYFVRKGHEFKGRIRFREGSRWVIKSDHGPIYTVEPEFISKHPGTFWAMTQSGSHRTEEVAPGSDGLVMTIPTILTKVEPMSDPGPNKVLSLAEIDREIERLEDVLSSYRKERNKRSTDGFLTEYMAICQKYHVCIDSSDGRLQLIRISGTGEVPTRDDFAFDIESL